MGARYLYAVLILCLWAVSPISKAGATTLNLDFEFTFDAVKTEHTCHSYLTTDPIPDGTCGLYQEFEIGETYAGYINFSGIFELEGDGVYRGNYRVNTRCKDGNLCLYGEVNDVEVTKESFSFDFSDTTQMLSGAIDLTDGTGNFSWEDDGLPWGKGHFVLSNIKVDGLSALFTNTDLVSMPVPASLPLLAGGLVGLWGWRRRHAPARSGRAGALR